MNAHDDAEADALERQAQDLLEKAAIRRGNAAADRWRQAVEEYFHMLEAYPLDHLTESRAWMRLSQARSEMVEQQRKGALIRDERARTIGTRVRRERNAGTSDNRPPVAPSYPEEEARDRAALHGTDAAGRSLPPAVWVERGHVP